MNTKNIFCIGILLVLLFSLAVLLLERRRGEKLRPVIYRIFAGCSLVLLLAELILVCRIGCYAHPFGDDYSYSGAIYHAWKNGESILKALLNTVARFYRGWQGTYSAIVLMQLQPGIISEGAYALTAPVMLLSLLAGEGVLAYTWLRRTLHCSHSVWISVAALSAGMSIAFQPNPMQAFYWWNGAVYYTFYFGLFLLLASCLVALWNRPKAPFPFAAGILLSAVIGGGNYVTALLASVVLCLYLVLRFWKKREGVWRVAVLTAILLLGFAVNAFAPGNAVRAAANVGMAPVPAVLISLKQAAIDCIAWTKLPLLGLCISVCALLVPALRKSEFRFPYPIGITVLCFLLLACQNCPHFYALHEAGPGRLRDIVYDSYVLLLLACTVYWTGYFCRVRREKQKQPRRVGSACLLAGVLIMCVGLWTMRDAATPKKCLDALRDGSAATYDAENYARLAELQKAGEGADVVFPEFSVRPELLYYFNVSPNPEDFANIALAQFYHLHSTATTGE